MNNKLYKIPVLCLLFTIIFVERLRAQTSIEGPTCIVAGQECQYVFRGNWNDTGMVTVCVRGGDIQGSADSCRQGQGIRSVKIIWRGTEAGYLSITAGQSTASIDVLVTEKLHGGLIDSAYQAQLVKPDSIPASVICARATGGNCSPVYDYQWQQSADEIIWTDVEGGTSKDIGFNTAPTQHGFYRRKVTERKSGSISYSNVAAIYIIP